MPKTFLTLSLLDESFAVCRLAPGVGIPLWASRGAFFSVTRTPSELSIVCPETYVPADVECARDWRALKLEGPMDFELSGIVASIADPLANAGVAIYPLATCGTGYVLVKESEVSLAASALATYGHAVLA